MLNPSRSLEIINVPRNKKFPLRTGVLDQGYYWSFYSLTPTADTGPGVLLVILLSDAHYGDFKNRLGLYINDLAGLIFIKEKSR